LQSVVQQHSKPDEQWNDSADAACQGIAIMLLVLVCAGSAAFAAAPTGWLPEGWLGVLVESILVVEIASLALWLGARSSTP
jgi:hypothetical protein